MEKEEQDHTKTGSGKEGRKALSVDSDQPEGWRSLQPGHLFVFLQVFLQDNLLQLYDRIPSTCMRKLTSLQMQFNFLKAFSKQIMAFHHPHTCILKISCQAPAF